MHLMTDSEVVERERKREEEREREREKGGEKRIKSLNAIFYRKPCLFFPPKK